MIAPWAVNPVGALFDTQTFNDARESERAWEGVVETRTGTHPLGWTVEMRIPFTTLRYRPSDEPQTWGMNLFRRVRRRNEDASWAAVTRQFRPYKISLEGTLTGLQLSRPARNLSVKPYALATSTSGAHLGLDAKWGITPRLSLDATLNTDFALTSDRFSVFFPEKRDFFLENEGAFALQDIAVRCAVPPLPLAQDRPVRRSPPGTHSGRSAAHGQGRRLRRRPARDADARGGHDAGRELCGSPCKAHTWVVGSRSARWW